MSDYLENLSESLYSELDSPSGISSAYVKQWLLNNIGDLNNELNTNYSGVTGTISPTLSGDAEFIYKKMFDAHWYSRQIKTSLGVGNYDWQVIREGDSEVRRISKTDVAKTYQVLKKDTVEELNRLINLYRSNKSIPQQVLEASGEHGASHPLNYISINY